MNGRMYDPSLGMFMSADPVVQFPANPLNYNRYSYYDKTFAPAEHLKMGNGMYTRGYATGLVFIGFQPWS